MNGIITPREAEHLTEIALLVAAEIGSDLSPDGTDDTLTAVSQIGALSTLLDDVRAGSVTGHPHNEIALGLLDEYWSPVVVDFDTSNDYGDVHQADRARAREVQDAIRRAMRQCGAEQRRRGGLRKWRDLPRDEKDGMVLAALGLDQLPQRSVLHRIFGAPGCDVDVVWDHTLRRHLKAMTERGLLATTQRPPGGKGRPCTHWVAIGDQVAHGIEQIEAFLREQNAPEGDQ